MAVTPVERIKIYFLRGLLITAISTIAFIIVYAIIFMIPTYFPDYWWLSWILFFLWLPGSIIFLGWLATQVVLHWIPAVRVEVKPAILAHEAGHPFNYLEAIREKPSEKVYARVLLKYTDGRWRTKNYWGFPEKAFYETVKEMCQSDFTEYVIVIYYDEHGRFIRAVGEKGTYRIFESQEELKRFVKTH